MAGHAPPAAAAVRIACAVCGNEAHCAPGGAVRCSGCGGVLHLDADAAPPLPAPAAAGRNGRCSPTHTACTLYGVVVGLRELRAAFDSFDSGAGTCMMRS
eukprot:gene8960-13462_t